MKNIFRERCGLEVELTDGRAVRIVTLLVDEQLFKGIDDGQTVVVVGEQDNVFAVFTGRR